MASSFCNNEAARKALGLIDYLPVPPPSSRTRVIKNVLSPNSANNNNVDQTTTTTRPLIQLYGRNTITPSQLPVKEQTHNFNPLVLKEELLTTTTTTTTTSSKESELSPIPIEQKPTLVNNSGTGYVTIQGNKWILQGPPESDGLQVVMQISEHTKGHYFFETLLCKHDIVQRRLQCVPLVLPTNNNAVQETIMTTTTTNNIVANDRPLCSVVIESDNHELQLSFQIKPDTTVDSSDDLFSYTIKDCDDVLMEYVLQPIQLSKNKTEK